MFKILVFRTRGRAAFLGYLLLALACIIFFEALSLGADTVTKVPLKVNVLEGVSVTDDDIEKIVKGVNKIFKRNNAGVAMEFDSGNDINRDVNDTGNRDGEIQQGEEKQLDEEGRKELDDSFGKGRGIKIYITNEIRDDPNTYGSAPHVKEKDGELTGKPTIYLKNRAGTTDSKANDATHEIVHVLTLGKGHTIDANTVADDTWHHPTDPNNLMWPYNPYRDPCGDPCDRGIELTPEQIEEIEEGAERLGKTISVTRPKPNEPNKIAPPIIKPVPTMHGGWVDLMGETSCTYTDLGAGFLFAKYPFKELWFDILFEGTFPEFSNTDMELWVYFNTDNNEATGNNYGGGVFGIDRVVTLDVNLAPYYIYKGMVSVEIENITEGGTTICPPGHVATIAKIVDTSDWNQQPEVTDYVSGIHIDLPMDFLGPLADEVPVVIKCKDWYSDDEDKVSFVWQVVDPNEPVLELLTTLVESGQDISLRGHNFTLDSEVKILIDDDLLGTTMANGEGQIEDDFPMPVMPFDDYIITARDESGGFCFAKIMIIAQKGDLNYDGKVDFSDFGIFADKWLAGVVE